MYIHLYTYIYLIFHTHISFIWTSLGSEIIKWFNYNVITAERLLSGRGKLNCTEVEKEKPNWNFNGQWHKSAPNKQWRFAFDFATPISAAVTVVAALVITLSAREIAGAMRWPLELRSRSCHSLIFRRHRAQRNTPGKQW